jgi:hypothetical protein
MEIQKFPGLAAALLQIRDKAGSKSCKAAAGFHLADALAASRLPSSANTA